MFKSFFYVFELVVCVCLVFETVEASLGKRPTISYYSKDGVFHEVGLEKVDEETIGSMSNESLRLLEKVAQFCQKFFNNKATNYNSDSSEECFSKTDTLNEAKTSLKTEMENKNSSIDDSDSSSEESFSEIDALFALNGAKMSLKTEMKNKNLNINSNSNIDDVIETLSKIKELGYEGVSGYRYCLAILCISFWDNLQPDTKKQLFDFTNLDKLDNKEYGLSLMRSAAQPKDQEGDDDCDAALYLQDKEE